MTTSIEQLVKDKYGSIAASCISNASAGVQAVAEAFGYSPEELTSIPADANMGLSCGNPTAAANLRKGEVVVDLGSGGGLDVFLAAKKVGPTGKAIGIDMTPAMIERARANAAKQGYTNVEFHLSSIDHLPLPDASVDCVISNCVVNLVEDKGAVIREIFRVLKPGGRLAISDIALTNPLPPEVSSDLLAYVGCIAGAIPIAEYEQHLTAAGFSAVEIVNTQKDLNAYSKVEGQSACCAPPALLVLNDSAPALEAESCCGPVGCSTEAVTNEVHGGLATLLAAHDVNSFAASVQIYALKSR